MNVLSLMAFALVSGSVTGVLSKRLTGHYLGPASMFWLAWFVLAVSALLAVEEGLVPEILPESISLVTEAFLGAAVGSLAGVYLSRRARGESDSAPDGKDSQGDIQWIARHAVVPYVAVTATLGAWIFEEAWSKVSFDIFRILEVRNAFVGQTSWPWPIRVVGYLSLLGTFLLVICGAADGAKKIRPGRVALIWLAQAPAGLALAGRGWTLAPLIIYVLSFLLARGGAHRRAEWRPVVSLSALAVAAFWIFVVIGSVRNLAVDRADAEALSIDRWTPAQTYMAAGWLGGSLYAAGIQGEFVEDNGPSYGEATFAFFSRPARYLGMFSGSKAAEWERWRTEVLPFAGERGQAWCMPPTALPYLVMDYGRPLMPVALGLLIAACQWLAVRWVGRGIVGHTVAFLAVYVMFNTIQTLVVFTSLTVGVIAWAFIVQTIARLRRVRHAIARPLQDGIK